MEALLRIVDANANRAREALRVLEDVARFAMDDGDLSAELKALRHELRAAVDCLTAERGGLGALLAWRDTPGDVGTAHSTAAEQARGSVRDVAAAAGKRLSESLRVLEECAKVISPPAAADVEMLRYRGYEAERRVLAALGTGRAEQWRLCVLVTECACLHHSWEEVARRAVEAGADCVQLREKGLGDREFLRRARRLVQIARDVARTPGAEGANPGPDGRAMAGRAAVVVNDRPDVALLSGADGVHVGQDDLPVREVRRLAGDRLIVGVSTHTPAQARAAAAEGADYCGVGPMFETTTKTAGPAAGPALLREYLSVPATARVPHLAIGGITAENVGELAAAGCRGVAVCAAVCGAADPGLTCRRLVAALTAIEPRLRPGVPT
jgi:thiamine-phosphate pyrophosphorylase